jgi:hypothetical protein
MGIANKAISTNFSTSLSEQIMDRQKLSCSREVFGVQQRVWPPLAATPIEHLWDELGRRVRHRQNDALLHEWKNITQTIQRLIGSMRRRSDAVVAWSERVCTSQASGGSRYVLVNNKNDIRVWCSIFYIPAHFTGLTSTYPLTSLAWLVHTSSLHWLD